MIHIFDSHAQDIDFFKRTNDEWVHISLFQCSSPSVSYDIVKGEQAYLRQEETGVLLHARAGKDIRNDLVRRLCEKL